MLQFFRFYFGQFFPKSVMRVEWNEQRLSGMMVSTLHMLFVQTQLRLQLTLCRPGQKLWNNSIPSCFYFRRSLH